MRTAVVVSPARRRRRARDARRRCARVSTRATPARSRAASSSSPPTAGLRQRLGHAARATAERRFGRRRLANELDEVYDALRRALTPALRVLHVHSGNLYGGVETFLTTLARDAAAAPRMTSSFALCFEGRLSNELRAHGHRAAHAGRRAIEPAAHRLAGAPIAGQASGPAAS